VPGRDVVFDQGFPRPGGFARLVAGEIHPARRGAGRRLSLHPHHRGASSSIGTAGAMTRRATVLDALRALGGRLALAWHHARLGIAPGDMVRVATRRGTVELFCPPGRRDTGRRGVHPLRLRGGGRQPAHQSGARSVRKDPEFKFCAAKVERADAVRERRSRGTGCESSRFALALGLIVIAPTMAAAAPMGGRKSYPGV